MKTTFKEGILKSLVFFIIIVTIVSCEKAIDIPRTDDEDLVNQQATTATNGSILLTIDEESIDNGNKPNNFSEINVNDQIARIGQRTALQYFKDNIGKSIKLYSGEVGDEGWHALKTIPNNWRSAGPANNGAANFVAAGPGLGGGNDPEKYLDNIPDVTPLRAAGLKMLVGRTILAVVYDSDISINYSPLTGSLKGDNLGLVALKVEKVARRTDGSSGSLPSVTVNILNVDQVKLGKLFLFDNPPVLKSSSEPYDINPPTTVNNIKIVAAT